MTMRLFNNWIFLKDHIGFSGEAADHKQLYTTSLLDV